LKIYYLKIENIQMYIFNYTFPSGKDIKYR